MYKEFLKTDFLYNRKNKSKRCWYIEQNKGCFYKFNPEGCLLKNCEDQHNKVFCNEGKEVLLLCSWEKISQYFVTGENKCCSSFAPKVHFNFQFKVQGNLTNKRNDYFLTLTK